jgi:hypothetical protein
MEKSVLRETVYAFNNNDIVATYDFDMDVWHPNRAKMASIVCEILPFDKEGNLKFLDLGVGTGYLSRRIIEAFPHATRSHSNSPLSRNCLIKKGHFRIWMVSSLHLHFTIYTGKKS